MTGCKVQLVLGLDVPGKHRAGHGPRTPARRTAHSLSHRKPAGLLLADLRLRSWTAHLGRHRAGRDVADFERRVFCHSQAVDAAVKVKLFIEVLKENLNQPQL